jgi:hypothetical protein
LLGNMCHHCHGVYFYDNLSFITPNSYLYFGYAPQLGQQTEYSQLGSEAAILYAAHSSEFILVIIQWTSAI